MKKLQITFKQVSTPLLFRSNYFSYTSIIKSTRNQTRLMNNYNKYINSSISSTILIKNQHSYFSSINKEKTEKTEKTMAEENQVNLEKEKQIEDEIKQSADNFYDSINNINDKDDVHSLEGFMRYFNTKVNKQNTELTSKIQDIFNSDNSNNNYNKIFACVNEINKVNINNSSKLLKLFLIEILKHKKEDNNSNNNTKEEKTSILEKLFWILSILIGYGIYQIYVKTNTHTSGAAKDTLDGFHNPEMLIEEISSLILPAFDHLAIPSCFGNEAQVQNKNLFLVGKKGIGKTISLKNYAVQEISKDNQIIYVDLKKGINWDLVNSDEDLVREIIIKSTPKYSALTKLSQFNDLELNLITKEFLLLLERRNVQFIFDNFEYDKDKKLLSYIKSLNLRNYKTIVATNTELKLRHHLAGSDLSNYQIKQIDYNYQRFKTYLLDRINKYIKITLERVTCDKLDQYNLALLNETIGGINFYDVLNYIDSNTTMKNFIEEQTDKLRDSLISMKVNEPEEFNYLINLLSEAKANSIEYVPISNNKNKNLKPNIELLDKFEKFGWISIKNYSNYRLDLSTLIKELEYAKNYI